MIAQAATRHQPSPFSPHSNRGRKYAPCTPHTPDSIYPSDMSQLASIMPYFSDPSIEQPMPLTWQLPLTPLAYETQPTNPDILEMVNELDNDQTDSQPQELSSQPQELDVLGGPVCFDSIMTPPTIEDQLQSSVSRTSSRSRPSTLPPSANDSWSCILPEHERARSEHSSGETQPFTAPVRPPSPPLKEMYADFILWDPADPGKSDNIHEKIPRSGTEIQQQKEDTAALKKAGGSCMACYRAKKKCGTATPCPPCSSKGNRICFRSWGDLCLLGPPAGGSPTIFNFPSQEARDNLQRMSAEVFERMNAFKAVVNIRVTYGGNCTAWHWTATPSSITLSSKTECPVDDFLIGVSSALPLVDLVKFEDQYKHNPLVWTALRMAKLFMAIQGLAQARIRTSWFEITTGRLVSFYILILSFRKLAEMSQDFCPGLYVALCGKDKQNNKKKSQSRKRNEIDPAWVAAALYYRVVCGLQDLQKNHVVARMFGASSCYLSGVREKLEDILRNVSPKHGATGKSSSMAILEDVVPKIPSSPDVDMAFWLGDTEEMSSSVLRRHDSPFSPPACEMRAFLADRFPRPWRLANPVEQHDGHLQSSGTSQNTVITQEQNAFDNMAYTDQIECSDSNGLLIFLNNDYNNAFDPMAATFVDTMPLDTMPLQGNFPQSLYHC
ncbi:hypothetical protein N7471_000678 [Penicillium samsonianum]|uniref:uncharacterized protein n=1 Tax=Penicillium samsonianum TaxID=1882272 RepID=UPI00254924AF|nr:uncharacterized protein N7471_000678 [Penicillium samsonianum]KAJ6149479.1 hypothetical protein N7471_000678 [Penicillium samsonianum]